MNVWNNAVITDKGLALQSKMMAGTSLQITRAIAGSGYVTPGLLQSQTEVIDPKAELEFRAVSYPEYGKCKLPLFLSNDNIEEGFKVRMIYLMAMDPDEGEIVFFVAQSVNPDEGTVVPSAEEMPGYSSEWTFYFQFGRADGVTVMVDPTGYVSREEMEAYVDQALGTIDRISEENIDQAFSKQTS
jgi:hypothetical protein